jgi:hypothetical protein
MTIIVVTMIQFNSVHFSFICLLTQQSKGQLQSEYERNYYYYYYYYCYYYDYYFVSMYALMCFSCNVYL